MDIIDTFLQERRSKNLIRELQPVSFRKNGTIGVNGRELFDFSSNDYLGLSKHPALIEAAREATAKFGTSASASRLLSGNLTLHEKLEQRTAQLKGKEAGIVFNSGYQANVGIISALGRKCDVIFCDRLSHASILDGVRLSGAKIVRFQHNHADHLHALLEKHRSEYRDALIVTESVFSMDGDIAPLDELVRFGKDYDCRIMVDEAHATGIFGKNGAGMISQRGLGDEVDLIMGTFSKALGGFGGYVACSKKMKEYLVNACRSFIYSTALPPGVIAANLAAMDILANEPFRRKALLENAAMFRDALRNADLNIRGQSQIVPLLVGKAEHTLELSKQLEEKGFCVPAIREPTVPAGQSRLRISLSYDHKKETLQTLAQEIIGLLHV